MVSFMAAGHPGLNVFLGQIALFLDVDLIENFRQMRQAGLGLGEREFAVVVGIGLRKMFGEVFLGVLPAFAIVPRVVLCPVCLDVFLGQVALFLDVDLIENLCQMRQA